jgi:hypothetical protein
VKTILALLLSLLFALLVPAAATAEVPVRTEQLIWSVLAFNGRDYSPAFATEASDTVYILAGADSFFSARKTLVYWWPITSEWKTDTDSLNVQFPGTLEVRDARGTVTKKPLEQYTYFNVKGEYELNWNVVTGEAASAELAKYARLYDEYFKAVAGYQLASAAYDEEMQSLGARIQKLREQKQDFAALLERMKTLPRPEQPQPPAYYVVPPAEMQQGFILNLAPGSYSIRLVNPDETVMEGSEKLLVVHDSGRKDGVGFEVIPSDRWTRPEASVTPSSVLYVNGSADLYLRPFFEKEFNDLAYERTLNTAARGNPNISKWVRIQQVPHAAIVLEKPGAEAATLAESPFYVEQAKGSALGYTIQPYDPAGAHKGKDANLIAFRVAVDRKVPALRLHARDAKGARIAGSERQIRVIGPIPTAWVLLALALAPLLVMAIVLAVRSRTYARGSSRET